MNIVNERVEHIEFGTGVVTEQKDLKIWVEFQNSIGTKMFLYPEAFGKFLKAVNPEVENVVLEELHRKQEQIELEIAKKEKERQAARLEEQRVELELKKKKSTTKSAKKK